MAKPSVYVTRDIGPEALAVLKNHCNVTMWHEPMTPVPRDEIIKNIVGKDALLCLLTDNIDAEILDIAGPKLKAVATMSVGFDHMDVHEMKTRNIKVGHTPNVSTDSVAELTVALLLATNRRLLEASEAARNGEWTTWSPFWMCGPSLSNSTVGIAGFGRIGQQVAHRVKAFNLKSLLYHDMFEKKEEAKQLGAEFVPFEELIKRSDFVIATCLLTPETAKMFNDDVFKKMKKTAVFINTSRGGVVDQDALIRALKTKTIWAAGLDVTVPEPLPTDSELFKLKNCVVLPHIASASIEIRNAMAMLAVNNILAALRGEPMPGEVVEY
ncbi:hypothetical protein RN001_013104 [Aquatica leii]|uniref:Glyoxylate reductase/hydroxypyruvate reductase n=1 Tax=Aquatica leii TaxID=1421715 RepID=A0AAN7NZM0_9COLE|nr:hypothetical protein RN001_013104 [Aquatica leii]